MGMFRVNDFEAWGNLVKRWSKGTQKWPKTIQELQDQCDAVGAGAVIKDFKTLTLVQAKSDDELLLRVPPTKFLVESEKNLKAGATYAIPGFYNRLFGSDEGPQIPTEQNMRVHAERIGDYTMAVCQ